MPEIRAYADRRGHIPFDEWMDDLSPPVRLRIQHIINRMEQGNPGDSRSVGDGVLERRAHFGPGYRIYYAWDNRTLIVLLGGGDKSDQREDIARAIERWKDYQNR
jgi:putative addiction module killer protein